MVIIANCMPCLLDTMPVPKIIQKWAELAYVGRVTFPLCEGKTQQSAAEGLLLHGLSSMLVYR